ncbi:MAG TPA: hypothetical protein VGE36_04475 [Roseateles sp.]
MTDITTPTELALQLADAYGDALFEQGLERRTEDPAPEIAREKLAVELRRIDDYVTEIGRLRNVIQAACLGGTDLMIERWKQLFPDAQVPSVKRPAPIGVEVVGVVRQGGDDGPEVEWLLEGGLTAVAEGGGNTYLLVSHQPITDDDGHGEVYRVAAA